MLLISSVPAYGESLALVIMGGALDDDGSMRDELIGRLHVGPDCAQQYPNAYVICTGGGTAKENKDITEAGQMGARPHALYPFSPLFSGKTGFRIIIEEIVCQKGYLLTTAN